ncbi:MAG: heavy-metal-associated domain-containing protein [Pseudomonadota bacterium]|nr:heavy-metal-associated domain-containing protein [Pseudomonadota bacterium]
MKLTIENMTCEGCAQSITTIIKNIDQTAELDFNIDAQTVDIKSSLPQEQITSALNKAGFEAKI